MTLNEKLKGHIGDTIHHSQVLRDMYVSKYEHVHYFGIKFFRISSVENYKRDCLNHINKTNIRLSYYKPTDRFDIIPIFEI